MKKILAMLTALCLMCTFFPALADTEIPVWDNMPAVVIDDGNTTVDEAAFEGDWVLSAAFLNKEYLDNEALSARFDYDFVPYHIEGGKITREIQNEYGEFVTSEIACTFEAGQLQGQEDGVDFVVELLEDGGIVMTQFLPGEGDAVDQFTQFMVRATFEEND